MHGYRMILRVGLLFIALSGAAHAQDESLITVNTTDDADDGVCDAVHCSLREAINAANADADVTTIAFNLPGAGVQTIQPTAATPAIITPIIIDGTTQPGYAGTPLIELDGANVKTTANGLFIAGGNSAVAGLIINHFKFAGIALALGGHNVITGNYIGTDSSGSQAQGNRDGIYVFNSPNNIIGGTTPEARNVVSGNHDDGINLEGAGATGNIISGNFIGTNAAGTDALGNRDDGIKISGAVGNTIGGTDQGAGNLISGNHAHGVYVTEAGASGNMILGNSIRDNGGKGIGLDKNTLADAPAFPELSVAATDERVVVEARVGSAPDTDFRVEFFSNPECDPSGYGEGAQYVAFAEGTTDKSGNAIARINFPVNTAPQPFVTATVTDAAGNTSEFSACVVMPF